MKARNEVIGAALALLSAWTVHAHDGPLVPSASAAPTPSTTAAKAENTARFGLDSEQPPVPPNAHERSRAAHRSVATDDVLDQAVRCLALDGKSERQACLVRIERSE
jgi:hypothetical protein